MANGSTKTQKLTVLLMKESVKSFKAALRDSSSLTPIPLKTGMEFTGEFWHGKPQVRTPQWQRFVDPVLASKIKNLTTTSVSALLFVKAKGRIFALTFGYGRNLLKPDSFELGFGLKVVLNRIDHERIRSLDVRTYEDLVVSTRKQTSRSSELGAFGLDISRDLIRAVTGEPNDKNFARRLTGADSLTLNVPITASSLGKKCEQILGAYEDDRYKHHFDWIDHLNEVRDTKLIDTLNMNLIQTLKDTKTEKLHLAAPEALDWQSIESFRIGGTRQTEYDDLDIDEYLAALGEKKDELTVGKLKLYRVSIRWTGTEQFQDRWSLFNCIVWERTEGERLYVLVEGRWFEIEGNFSKRVSAFVNGIPAPTKQLPVAKAKEREEKYNERVAAGDPNLVCLDGNLVKPEDAASEIEFCDLLSKQKQFIHVKKRTRSATLSHLFAQGTVAGREFLQDGQVREQVRKHLKGKSGASGFVSLIPNAKTRPSAVEYEIAYAIITKPTANWPLSLPFFSQLNLMQNARLLRGLGYRVTLQQVEES